MIAGQHWSAVTRSARRTPSSGLALVVSDMVASDMAISLAESAERDPARRQLGDRDEEVGGLRCVGAVADRLGGAVAGDEAGVAVLPADQLPVEEGTPAGTIGEGGQVAVETGEE